MNGTRDREIWEERKQNLFGDVLITGLADEGKGQQKHICSSIAQGP